MWEIKDRHFFEKVVMWIHDQWGWSSHRAPPTVIGTASGPRRIPGGGDFFTLWDIASVKGAATVWSQVTSSNVSDTNKNPRNVFNQHRRKILNAYIHGEYLGGIGRIYYFEMVNDMWTAEVHFFDNGKFVRATERYEKMVTWWLWEYFTTHTKAGKPRRIRLPNPCGSAS